MSLKMSVTVYDRQSLMSNLKELGFTWIESEGLLDKVLIALHPNHLVPTQKTYVLSPTLTEHFQGWVRNLGLEDELFYLGYSQLGRRLDTEFFQTIYPQFDLDRYIEDSEYYVSRYAVKEVLRFFEQFTYKDVVFVEFKEF